MTDLLRLIVNHTGATYANTGRLVSYFTQNPYALPMNAVYDLYSTSGTFYHGFPATMAEGDLVTSPTYAMIGEAGYPEAVIPMKDGINIPVKWVNGGSTQAGAQEEEIELLREQNRLLAKLVTQSGQPMKIEGLGRYAKAKADEVIVSRNSRGKLSDTRRYY